MTCQEYRKFLDTHADGTVSEFAAIMRHSGACGSCREYSLREIARLSKGLSTKERRQILALVVAMAEKVAIARLRDPEL